MTEPHASPTIDDVKILADEIATLDTTIESLEEPLLTLIQEDRLGKIKGIGEALQKKITELVQTGQLNYYDDLKASLPQGLFEIMDIPGMGPKKVKAVYDKLGVDSIEKLTQAQSERLSRLQSYETTISAGDEARGRALFY